MRTFRSLLIVCSLVVCGLANASGNFIFVVDNQSKTSTDEVYLGTSKTPVATVAPGATSKTIATQPNIGVIVKSSDHGYCDSVGSLALTKKFLCSDQASSSCGCLWTS